MFEKEVTGNEAKVRKRWLGGLGMMRIMVMVMGVLMGMSLLSRELGKVVAGRERVEFEMWIGSRREVCGKERGDGS